MLVRACSRVGARLRQLPKSTRHLASALSPRARNRSNSWGDRWKKIRWPTSPRSPAGKPSKPADRTALQEAKDTARWVARKEEIKHLDERFPRTLRGEKLVRGDKMTDCIYVITIDGKEAYVGQTNDFETRERRHRSKMIQMQERNPGAAVEMHRVHGDARDEKGRPERNEMVSQHGAQLDAIEGYYMEFYGTLADKCIPVGEGMNRYRWNQRDESCTANGETTSNADRARIKHLHVCDGPSNQPCDGNMIFTQQNVDAMIEEVESARAVEAMCGLALVEQVEPVAKTEMSGCI